MRRAEALLDMGRPQLAIPVLTQALTSTPDDSQVLCWLAYAYDQAGLLREALETADKAVAAEPSYPWAHVMRATTLWRWGQLPAATEAAREAVALDPWYLDGLVTLAEYLAKIGAGEEAMKIAQRAVRTHPHAPEARSAQAFSAWVSGKLEGAERGAQDALRLDPSEGAYHNNLGWSLALQGKYAEALPYFRRAVELVPEDQWWANLAYCLRALGDSASADDIRIKFVTAELANVEAKLLDSAVESSQLELERAHCYRLLERSEDALNGAERALALAETPADFINASVLRVTQLLDLDRDADAVRGSWELLRYDRLDWVNAVEAGMIGWHTQRGDLARAAADFALARVGTAEFAAHASGYAALAEEDWQAAQDFFAIAIRRGALRITCCEHVGLATAKRALGDVEGARAAYDIASWMNPVCSSVRRQSSVFEDAD